MKTVYILASMDCEPVRSEVREEVRNVSLSGPADWEQSERVIHPSFRQVEAQREDAPPWEHPFIEVPVAVDYSRSVTKGAAGEAGYE